MGILGHKAWVVEDFFAMGIIARVQRGGVGTMVVLEKVVDWPGRCEGLVLGGGGKGSHRLQGTCPSIHSKKVLVHPP